MAKEKGPDGRVISSYTPELAKTILWRISEGEPLKKICREEGMPHFTTVYDWERVHHEFHVAMNKARIVGYDAIASDTLLVAEGVEGYSSGDVNRDKLIVHTRMQLLSKWSSRYGEKYQVEHTGEVSLTPDARQAEIDRLLKKRESGEDGHKGHRPPRQIN